MLNAIGSSTFSSPANVGKSTSGLEAQLDRYQKELSSCINCSSAKTAEGKQNIQSISDKISVLRVRIEEITAAKLNAQKVNTQSAAFNQAAPAEPNANKDAFGAGAQYNSAGKTVFATGSTTETVGNRLNVFA